MLNTDRASNRTPALTKRIVYDGVFLIDARPAVRPHRLSYDLIMCGIWAAVVTVTLMVSFLVSNLQ